MNDPTQCTHLIEHKKGSGGEGTICDVCMSDYYKGAKRGLKGMTELTFTLKAPKNAADVVAYKDEMNNYNDGCISDVTSRLTANNNKKVNKCERAGNERKVNI